MLDDRRRIPSGVLRLRLGLLQTRLLSPLLSFKECPKGEVRNVGTQCPIDSFLCLRCASVRLCGIVTGPPLLDALEYAISHGEEEDDCARYQAILDSGWVNQVFPKVSLAGCRPVGVYPLLHGEVMCMGSKIPLGMQRGFYMRYCLSKRGFPHAFAAFWETAWAGQRDLFGLSRSYRLVFGNFQGRGSVHFKRW